MNTNLSRRSFLRGLFSVAAVATAPKFIFDMGANLYKIKPLGGWYDEANLFKAMYGDISLNHYNSSNPIIETVKKFEYRGVPIFVSPLVPRDCMIFVPWDPETTEEASILPTPPYGKTD